MTPAETAWLVCDACSEPRPTGRLLHTQHQRVEDAPPSDEHPTAAGRWRCAACGVERDY